MNVEKIHLTELIESPDNPRIHPENQIEEMCKSLDLFGQYRPIVIDEKNKILAGHGIFMALKKKGFPAADVLRFKNLTESQKKKLMLADNKIASLGFDNNDKVFDIIKGMDDFKIPGFDEQILVDLLIETDAVMNSYGAMPNNLKGEGFQTQNQAPQSSSSSPVSNSNTGNAVEQRRLVKCPHCNEEFEL